MKNKFNIILFFLLPTLSLAQLHLDTLYIAVPCNSNDDLVYHYDSKTIEQQLLCIENKIPLSYNVHTAGFINYFTIRRRSYITSMLEKKDMYFSMYEQKLKAHNLPDELKYLSIVESGLNAKAHSSAGALGLWQFIGSTGKMMGLRIDHHFDERMDPNKSTDAACRYLKGLHNSFGDWRHAIAAYNCGPGNVRKAQKKAGSKDFWKMYPFLPQETRAYVPQFMAVMYAMNYSDEYNLKTDTLEYIPTLDTVRINSYCNLDTFCTMLNYCFDDLLYVNRSLKRHYIPDSTNFLMYLPTDIVQKYKDNRLEINELCSVLALDNINIQPKTVVKSTSTAISSTKTRTYYKVRSGDYLGKIAIQQHVTIAELKKWNQISGNTIKVGQNLIIWKNSSTSNEPKTVKSTPTTTTPKEYIVQPGDTLWNISNRFNGVTPDQLKKLNNLKDDTIKPGQKLILG